MNTILQRLRAGERLWTAEVIFRGAGVAMLGACASLAWLLLRLTGTPPPHPANPLEFLVALFAIVCLWVGLALAAEGPGLLRIMPKPPRALL